MGFMQDKTCLILGLLSNRSIAYGIAQAMHQQGAKLAFTYQNDRFKDRIAKMAKEFDSDILIPCDVSDDAQITGVFDTLKTHWDNLDCMVHSLAYAPADQIQGDFTENTNREGFLLAHNISSYSLAALAKAARPMMQNRDASIIAMTYLGSECVIPNYNVMGLAKASLEAGVRYLADSLGPQGIRVNAISAGPIRTLAASGIKSFREMLDFNEKVTPLRKNVTIEQVGNTAAFLGSNLSSGITGEIIHVDAGYHCIGMPIAKDN